MKCPKCGGRTITEDVHTYLGQQQERKCIVCGKRFVQPIAGNQPPPEAEATPAPPRQSKSIGTCSVCHRPDQYLTRGMCGRDYQSWRRASLAGSAETPVENQQPQQSPWRGQLYNRAELAKHEAKQPAAIPFGFESEEEKAYQTGAPMPANASPQSKPEDWQITAILPGDMLIETDCNSGRTRRVQGRGQRAEGRGQRAEGREARHLIRPQSKFSR